MFSVPPLPRHIVDLLQPLAHPLGVTRRGKLQTKPRIVRNLLCFRFTNVQAPVQLMHPRSPSTQNDPDTIED